MKLLNTTLALSFAALTAFTVSAAVADDHHDHDHAGEELNVHNNTGHEAVIFLFQDDHVHLDEGGGTQVAAIANGKSAVAHVPNCTFSILLVDHEDVWHAEFHDCHSTELTFTKDDKRHAKKPAHH